MSYVICLKNRKMKQKEIIEKVLVRLSLICFLFSLFLPAFSVYRPSITKLITFPGWYTFLLGSTSLFLDFGQSFVWLANIIFIVALWSMNKNERLFFWLSLLLIIQATFFLSFETIKWTGSGRLDYIESVGFGYWVWLVSFLLLLCASIINRLRSIGYWHIT